MSKWINSNNWVTNNDNNGYKIEDSIYYSICLP